MNNIDTSSSPIEQLWYTWSDVGLSTIHAGFRIRAASPGLTEIYSERVKNIERTMRYVLPPGTDRSITPDMAPVGLAFIRSEWNGEYLLIHKKYIGEDGVGRQGNFFAHALALGENRDFSTEDAIWQWEDAIWKTDSESLNGRSTSLQPLSIAEVYNTKSRFKPENFRQVQDALQFVIEAYLMRKSRSIPIYIAAPANQVVKIPTIIAGLTNCLPAQLINGLTFSTYEPDITKTTAEIVGTSWIPTPSTSQDATAVLPQSAYLDKLAINCETQNHSNLQSHPQIIYNQLAASFAAFAAENLAMGSVEQLYSLRDYAEQSRTLDIGLFLEIYRSEVADTEGMDERGIEKYLNSDLGAEWLAQKSSRKKVIDRVIINPLWGGGRLKDILLSLRGQAATTAQPAGRIGTSALSTDSEQMASVASPEIRPRRRNSKGSAQTRKPPITLADALALLAKSMVPEVKKYMSSSRGSQTGNLSSEHRLKTVFTLITLMDSCLLPQDPTEVWKQLFETIEGNKSAIAYLTTEWSIQSRLLRIWNNMFPPDWQENDRMRPLLSISWSRLGDFLHLGLHSRHPQWVVFPIQELITAPSSLTPQITKELEYTYSSEIATLLTTLEQGQHSDPSLITIGASLIVRLVEKGYSVNTTIEPHVERLLDALNRTGQWRAAKDLVTALLLVHYAGSERYQNLVAALAQSLLQSPQKAVGQDLVDALIKYDFPRSWLIDLLILINGTPVNLLGIIQFVYSKQDGQNTFFIQHGSRYLETSDYVKDMLTLYQQLLPLNGKMERLFVLLNNTTHQATIVSLLDSTSFTPAEWYTILQQHGRHYLQRFQEAPELANIVVTRFNQLVLQSGYSNELLFTILPTPPTLTGDHYLNQLLSVKELTIEQQARFLEKYGANYFVHYPKMPILSRYISTYVANFNLNSLEREEAKNFFGFLTHNSNYKKLSLDGITINKIEKWQIIDSYFQVPTTNPQILQNLAVALYSLGLPNNTQFIEKLARAFLSCIQTNSDILAIREQMQVVPKLTNEKADEYHFLYTLAEQAAEKYSSQKSIKVLTPYLIFALAMSSRERPNHFFHMFMDKLLYYVSSYDTFTWASLNTVVEAHGLSTTAIQRWRQYLYGLELWDKIASKSVGRRATTSESASRSSMPPAETSSSGQIPGEYSATVKKEKSSLAQRARSIRLPWQKEQALDTPPTNGALVPPPPDATQTMYPPMNNGYPSNPDPPTDARYLGTTNNNQSSNISSSGLSFGHHQQDSNRRGR